MGVTGTSELNAYAFMEGADVNLDGGAEALNALSMDIKYGAANSDPVIGLPGTGITYIEGDDPTIIGLPMIWVSDRLLELGYLSPQKM